MSSAEATAPLCMDTATEEEVSKIVLHENKSNYYLHVEGYPSQIQFQVTGTILTDPVGYEQTELYTGPVWEPFKGKQTLKNRPSLFMSTGEQAIRNLRAFHVAAEKAVRAHPVLGKDAGASSKFQTAYLQKDEDSDGAITVKASDRALGIMSERDPMKAPEVGLAQVYDNTSGRIRQSDWSELRKDFVVLIVYNYTAYATKTRWGFRPYCNQVIILKRAAPGIAVRLPNGMVVNPTIESTLPDDDVDAAHNEEEMHSLRKRQKMNTGEVAEVASASAPEQGAAEALDAESADAADTANAELSVDESDDGDEPSDDESQ